MLSLPNFKIDCITYYYWCLAGKCSALIHGITSKNYVNKRSAMYQSFANQF